MLRQLTTAGVVVVSSPFMGSRLLFASVDPTPQQAAGPYYRPGAPVKDDLIEPEEQGITLLVTGLLIGMEEEPLPQGKIEIWHADSTGRYDMSGFRHRAELPLDARGRYSFRTVLPANYGGRPKHIHYRISALGYEPLITQLYFESDAFFEGDPQANLRKDPLVRYRELIRPVSWNEEQASVYFPICLKKQA